MTSPASTNSCSGGDGYTKELAVLMDTSAKPVARLSPLSCAGLSVTSPSPPSEDNPTTAAEDIRIPHNRRPLAPADSLINTLVNTQCKIKLIDRIWALKSSRIIEEQSSDNEEDTSLLWELKHKSLLPQEELLEDSCRRDAASSQNSTSDSQLNFSRASSFLENSVIGRLNVGWKDEPNIVALFLSGQLERRSAKDSNSVSFYDDNHSSMFKVPEFELKPSPLLANIPSRSTIAANNNNITSPNLDRELQSDSIDKKHPILSLSLPDFREKVMSNLQEISTMQSESNSSSSQSSPTVQCSIPDSDTGVCSTPFFPAPDELTNNVSSINHNNLFSTTIISAPQIIDSSTRLPDDYLPSSIRVPVTNEATGATDHSSPFQTASTPTKSSQDNNEYSFQTPSQGKLMSEATTPDTRTLLQRNVNASLFNPFDSCAETLQMPTVSPSLFKEVISPSTARETDGANFRWSIEQIALLNPVSIEMPPNNSGFDTPHDPEYEKEAQDAIDKYFSRRCVLPSPWTNSVPKSKIKAEPSQCKYSLPTSHNFTPHLPNNNRNKVFSGPAKCKVENSSKKFNTVSCQTALSFPSELPPEFEAMLARFTNPGNNDQADSVESSFSFSNTSLRRRLLFSNDDVSSCSPSLNPCAFSNNRSKSRTPLYPNIVHVDSSTMSTPSGISHHASPLPSGCSIEESSPITSAIHPWFCDASNLDNKEGLNVRHSFSPGVGAFMSSRQFENISPIKFNTASPHRKPAKVSLSNSSNKKCLTSSEPKVDWSPAFVFTGAGNAISPQLTPTGASASPITSPKDHEHVRSVDDNTVSKQHSPQDTALHNKVEVVANHPLSLELSSSSTATVCECSDTLSVSSSASTIVHRHNTVDSTHHCDSNTLSNSLSTHTLCPQPSPTEEQDLCQHIISEEMSNNCVNLSATAQDVNNSLPPSEISQMRNDHSIMSTSPTATPRISTMVDTSLQQECLLRQACVTDVVSKPILCPKRELSTKLIDDTRQQLPPHSTTKYTDHHTKLSSGVANVRASSSCISPKLNQFSSSPIRNAEVSHIISPSSCCSTSPSVSPIPWRRRSARHLSRRQASPPAATTNGERRYTASPVVSTKCQMSRRQLPAPAAQTPARRTINDACLFQSRGPAWSDNTTTTSSCGSVSVPPRTSRLASDIMVSTPAGSPTSGVEIDSSNATPEGCDISCIDMTNGASERSPREGAVYGAGAIMRDASLAQKCSDAATTALTSTFCSQPSTLSQRNNFNANKYSTTAVPIQGILDEETTDDWCAMSRDEIATSADLSMRSPQPEVLRMSPINMSPASSSHHDVRKLFRFGDVATTSCTVGLGTSSALATTGGHEASNAAENVTASCDCSVADMSTSDVLYNDVSSLGASMLPNVVVSKDQRTTFLHSYTIVDTEMHHSSEAPSADNSSSQDTGYQTGSLHTTDFTQSLAPSFSAVTDRSGTAAQLAPGTAAKLTSFETAVSAAGNTCQAAEDGCCPKQDNADVNIEKEPSLKTNKLGSIDGYSGALPDYVKEFKPYDTNFSRDTLLKDQNLYSLRANGSKKSTQCATSSELGNYVFKVFGSNCQNSSVASANKPVTDKSKENNQENSPPSV